MRSLSRARRMRDLTAARHLERARALACCCSMSTPSAPYAIPHVPCHAHARGCRRPLQQRAGDVVGRHSYEAEHRALSLAGAVDDLRPSRRLRGIALTRRRTCHSSKRASRQFDGRTLTTDKGALRRAIFSMRRAGARRSPPLSQPGFVDRGRLTVGMEVTVPHRTDAMHFYVNREIVRWGYGWIFPCGDESRVGLGAFDNPKGLPGPLARLPPPPRHAGRPADDGADGRLPAVAAAPGGAR